MAAVVRTRPKRNSSSGNHVEKSIHKKVTDKNSQLTTPLLPKVEGILENVTIDIENPWKKVAVSGQPASLVSTHVEDGEVIGIITLEDVFEELLQEEIVDETDEYVDVHKRIRVVAAAAAASSIIRAPSLRRMATGFKGLGAPNKQGQTPCKANGEDMR